MEQEAGVVRPIGRPPIGPEVKTRAPEEVVLYIKLQAKRRRVRAAAIARELIIAGYYASREDN